MAAAARTVGLTVETAGALVRLWAIEREAAEQEAEERLDDIQRMCPGEDWWSYTERQLSAIEQRLGDPEPDRARAGGVLVQADRADDRAVRRDARDR